MFDSIYVELTSICNMACEFCSHKDMSRLKKHMDYALFTKVIDEIAANDLTKHIRLAAVGESLLYPQLSEAIRYCSERKLKTSIITNSIGLTTVAYQNIVDSGLNELQISLQDLSEDSFRYRHAKNNINYPSFYQNIINIINYHVGQDISASIIIHLLFCKEQWISSKLWDLPAIKNNTKHAAKLLKPFMDEMREIAAKNNLQFCITEKIINNALGSLDVFMVKKIKITRNLVLYLTSLNHQVSHIRKKINGPLGKNIKLVKRTKGSCPSFRAPMVLSDGSFVPCCADVNGELVVGKIDGRRPLISIINDKKYRNMREGFENDSIVNPVCQECKGRLVYKNPMFQMLYLIRSFNIYVFNNKIIDRVNYCLRNIWQK